MGNKIKELDLEVRRGTTSDRHSCCLAINEKYALIYTKGFSEWVDRMTGLGYNKSCFLIVEYSIIKNKIIVFDWINRPVYEIELPITKIKTILLEIQKYIPEFTMDDLK